MGNYSMPQQAQPETANTGNESWRKDAFINISLPSDDGSMKKLGKTGLGLSLKNASEKALIEWLQQDPENIKTLMAHAVFDFQLVDGSSARGFAIPSAS